MKDGIVNFVDDPSEARLDPKCIQRAYAVLDRFASDGSLPGGVALIGHGTHALRPRPFGVKSTVPPGESVTADTIYDCASLTKVVVTAPLVWMLIDRGLLRLDDAVSRFIPEFVQDSAHVLDAAKKQVTIRHLLTHTSGLEAWRPLYNEGTGHADAVKAICKSPLTSPPGKKVVYSCLGFILLGDIIQKITDTPLDQLAKEWLFEPLNMTDSCYNPDPSIYNRIAPTEAKADDQPELALRGVVHDENARSMGGVSGNAGLFSTAHDLAQFSTMIFNNGQAGTSRIISQSSIRASIVNDTDGLDAARGLGWDIKGTQRFCSAGDLFAPSSFGHTGFTGTSLWFDPSKTLFVILLTNRVHPTRDNQVHLRLRPLFHNAVAASVI